MKIKYPHNRIKELRLENRINQSQLAEKVGVSTQTISKYERKEKNPSLKVLRQLALFFNVSIDYLTGKSGSLPEDITDIIVKILHYDYFGIPDENLLVKDIDHSIAFFVRNYLGIYGIRNKPRTFYKANENKRVIKPLIRKFWLENFDFLINNPTIRKAVESTNDPTGIRIPIEAFLGNQVSKLLKTDYYGLYILKNHSDFQYLDDYLCNRNIKKYKIQTKNFLEVVNQSLKDLNELQSDLKSGKFQNGGKK